VLQITYPAGTTGGSQVGLWQFWDPSLTEVGGNEYTGLYEHGWWRSGQSGFEMTVDPGIKMLGYYGVGLNGTQLPIQIYTLIENAGNPTTASQFALYQQGVGDRRMASNQGPSGYIKLDGSWQEYEIQLVLNTVGQANGIARVWWNGVLVLAYTDVEWRTAAAPSGFYGRRFDAVYGGSGTAKTRTDNSQLADVYLSGVQ
jgi:hypothetical protein